jgi:hypothetical protein
METVLGLFELLFYVLAILSLSAAVTFAVVKISPAKRTPSPTRAEAAPSAPSLACVRVGRATTR